MAQFFTIIYIKKNKLANLTNYKKNLKALNKFYIFPKKQ